MPAHIRTLTIPTTDPLLAVRIYERLFDTRLTAQQLPDPFQMALLSNAVPADDMCTVTHFTDSHGNLVALHAST
ncbi:hypothetical protein [Oxalicibacterium solurbis]|uniref:Uncharacterized protein n=1 Tax=Oxalicibacterium solurbis TaxID=69280 RepID=A0A8J3AUX3_9BURK|nr:hypothetical protein [Oxalicibacterium solurbis]GGI54099.1 hypothetical protein GCM10011430_12730 [Oxalicibacterium solurbis]